MSENQLPIQFSDAAANKVKVLISEEENPELKLRVYVTGGGCSGFQYGFTFDEKVNDGDMTIVKQGVTMVIDPMSLQYLVGGTVKEVISVTDKFATMSYDAVLDDARITLSA